MIMTVLLMRIIIHKFVLTQLRFCVLCLLVSDLKEQKKVDSGDESLDSLEEVFEQIQTVTGEDNLDLLVSRFIQGNLL